MIYTLERSIDRTTLFKVAWGFPLSRLRGSIHLNLDGEGISHGVVFGCSLGYSMALNILFTGRSIHSV